MGLLVYSAVACLLCVCSCVRLFLASVFLPLPGPLPRFAVSLGEGKWGGSGVLSSCTCALKGLWAGELVFEARGGLTLRVPGWCLERLFPVPNFSKTLNKRSVTLRGKLIFV